MPPILQNPVQFPCKLASILHSNKWKEEKRRKWKYFASFNICRKHSLIEMIIRQFCFPLVRKNVHKSFKLNEFSENNQTLQMLFDSMVIINVDILVYEFTRNLLLHYNIVEKTARNMFAVNFSTEILMHAHINTVTIKLQTYR